jgi:3-hydroxyacyl-[acyl-carrier-protein] dehydratase
MNTLVQEIKQCMFDLSGTAEGEVTASFIFSPEFTGFQGHFPGRPVLPGVCMIQAVVVMLQIREKTKIRLKEIVLAKFFSSVSCGEKLVIDCRERMKKGNEILVKAVVSSDNKKIAELKLKLSFENGR